MTSSSPRKYCTIGIKDEGKPNGEMLMLGNVESYVCYPQDKQTHTAIIYLTDVMGHRSIESQRLADQFAENGYFVVMPDQFEGDAVPLPMPKDFDIMEWHRTGGPHGKGHWPDHSDPIIEKVIKHMKSEYRTQRIGGVGYCFGAKACVRFMAPGKGIDVGCLAHPSFIEGVELINAVGPLTIAAPEMDFVFPASKRREAEDYLRDLRMPYQLTLYGRVAHGYAVRTDRSNKVGRFQMESTFLQFIHWLGEFLPIDPDI